MIQRILFVRRQLRELRRSERRLAELARPDAAAELAAFARYTASTLAASTSDTNGRPRPDALLPEGGARPRDRPPRRQPQRRRRRHPRRARSASPTSRRTARARCRARAPSCSSACPQELKDAIQAEAFRRGSNANDVILAALADELGVPSNRTEHGPSLRGRPRKGTPWPATNGSTNGKARSKDKVRVAIIGVGNCANSLLQGVEYYKDADRRRSSSRASCTSTSAATTSRTSSSPPPSTSSRARSASTSPRRSGRTRTTRSSSPTCRRPASRSRAA